MADIYSVVSKYVSLHKHGREYIGVCPFHEEKYPSFKVNVEKNIFKCFGCGKGGSPYMFIKLYNEKNNTNHRIDNTAEPIKPKQEFKDKIDDWKIIAPVPVWVEQPSFRHFNYGVPSDVFRFPNEKGLTMFYTCRFNLPNDSKEVLPFSYCTNGKQGKWMWRAMKDNRPMYGLLKILNNNKPIVLVEGEGKCDVGNKSCDEFVFASWQGGANGYKLTDFSVLKGRDVILLQDNDDKGMSAMDGIESIINPYVNKVYRINQLVDKPNKWDIKDHRWANGELYNFIKTRIRR
jgi:hypothetical protein